MNNDGHGDKKDHLEAHSFPGTNQAGKGPGSRRSATKNTDPAGRSRSVRNSSGHTALPGTNQAGKGRGSSDKHARAARQDS